jgi:hypothetical protein
VNFKMPMRKKWLILLEFSLVYNTFESFFLLNPIKLLKSLYPMVYIIGGD